METIRHVCPKCKNENMDFDLEDSPIVKSGIYQVKCVHCEHIFYPYAEHSETSFDFVTSFDHDKGLYGKYRVMRTDGSSLPGGKHEHCQYFVLDLNHDAHAAPAIRAYAQSCQQEYPKLSLDLFQIASNMDRDLLHGFHPSGVCVSDNAVKPEQGSPGASRKIPRLELTEQDFESAVSIILQKLEYRKRQKGLGIFSSSHESLGVISDEVQEYRDEVHNKDKAAQIKELMDVAVGCIWGIASIMSGGQDW